MNDKEINEAIAMYFGYRKKTGYIDANGETKGEWVGPDGYTYDEIPDDYCGDLNAMHDAEKTLTDEQFSKYGWILLADGNIECRAFLGATARQRAEAFLKTIDMLKTEDNG